MGNKPCEDILTGLPTVLQEYYSHVLSYCDETIAWYKSNRMQKGHWAKFFRAAGVILLALSTTIPFISFLFDKDSGILFIGYLLAGLGAGVLAIDKYCGISNSWIRFVLTGMELENAKSSFVYQFKLLVYQYQPLSRQDCIYLAQVIRDFQTSFSSIVLTETQTWAREFQENLRDMSQNLNRKTQEIKANLETALSNEADQRTELPQNVPESVIRQAIAANYSKWKEEFGLIGIGPGKKITANTATNQNAIVFITAWKSDEPTEGRQLIPQMILFESDGIQYKIPTDVLSADGKAQSAAVPALLCDQDAVKRPGCSISREKAVDKTGTFGMIVYRGTTAYVLSCYHVLLADELEKGNYKVNEGQAVTDPGIVSPGNGDAGYKKNIATVTEGYFGNHFDCAIAVINDNSIQNAFCKIGAEPTISLPVNSGHVAEAHSVLAVGRTSGVSRGRIVNASASVDIEYLINHRWAMVEMQELIVTNQLIERGDSGAMVVDYQDRVIGMLIGKSGALAYLLPIERVLNVLSVTIKPTP